MSAIVFTIQLNIHVTIRQCLSSLYQTLLFQPQSNLHHGQLSIPTPAPFTLELLRSTHFSVIVTVLNSKVRVDASFFNGTSIIDIDQVVALVAVAAFYYVVDNDVVGAVSDVLAFCC
jgi:hypothetical protein